MPELPQNHPSEQDFIDCTKFHDNRTQIVLKENRSEYQAKNADKKKVQVCKVDGCLLDTDELQKCDYLLLVDGSARFIELKGCDIGTAIEQLIATVNILMPGLQKNYPTAYSIIVSTRTPKIINQKKWEALKKLMKRYNGDAFKSNSPFIDHI
ncbi:MAG: hypothetical protein WCR52_10755 [Bacteroidota bacterium]